MVFFFLFFFSGRKDELLHLVDVLVSYWEGESEAQREFLVLDVVFVQEI